MQQIHFECDLGSDVVVLGRDSEALLFDFPLADHESQITAALRSGFRHQGVLAAKGGEVMVSPAAGAEGASIAAAIDLYERIYPHRLGRAGDSVDWLRKLYALADTRAEVAHA